MCRYLIISYLLKPILYICIHIYLSFLYLYLNVFYLNMILCILFDVMFRYIQLLLIVDYSLCARFTLVYASFIWTLLLTNLRWL